MVCSELLVIKPRRIMKVRYIGNSSLIYCIDGRIHDKVGEFNGYWKTVDESGED